MSELEMRLADGGRVMLRVATAGSAAATPAKSATAADMDYR